jgi:hypothetical protein
MSIVLVTFPGVPQPSSEAIQQEAELEASIERRITGNNNSGCISHLFSYIIYMPQIYKVQKNYVVIFTIVRTQISQTGPYSVSMVKVICHNIGSFGTSQAAAVIRLLLL